MSGNQFQFPLQNPFVTLEYQRLEGIRQQEEIYLLREEVIRLGDLVKRQETAGIELKEKLTATQSILERERRWRQNYFQLYIRYKSHRAKTSVKQMK